MLLQRVGQVDDRPRLDHVPGVDIPRGGRVLVRDQRQLLLGVDAVIRVEGAVQVALHQVVQVEGRLARAREVGGQRGVAGDAVDRPAARGQRVDRRLEVVADLGRRRVGEPLRQRRLVVRVGADDVDHRRRPVRGRQREGVHVAAIRRPGAADEEPDPSGGVLGQPGPDGAGREPGAGDLETLGAGLVLLDERLQQPLAQHPELQVVEDPVDRLPVVRHGREVGGRVGVDRHLPDQLGQPPVHQHVGQVLPQRVADLAADLVDPVDQGGEAAELADPLGGGLLPHPRDAGQVVRRVAAQRRVVGVLQRRQAVLGLHLLRREPGQLGHPALRVEHRHIVRNQLQRITIAGADPHLHALGHRPHGERRDDVVGLVVLGGDRRDPQRAQHLLDQLDLTVELRRGR